MIIKKISTVLVACMILSGCAYTQQPQNVSSTYGVPDDKWATMSLEQQNSAIEVYKLDVAKCDEQYKLKELQDKKSMAVAQRELAYQDEQITIEQEDAAIKGQKKKVNSAREMEKLKQKQREQELDNLKVTSYQADN